MPRFDTFDTLRRLTHISHWPGWLRPNRRPYAFLAHRCSTNGVGRCRLRVCQRSSRTEDKVSELAPAWILHANIQHFPGKGSGCWGLVTRVPADLANSCHVMASVSWGNHLRKPQCPGTSLSLGAMFCRAKHVITG